MYYVLQKNERHNAIHPMILELALERKYEALSEIRQSMRFHSRNKPDKFLLNRICPKKKNHEHKTKSLAICDHHLMQKSLIINLLCCFDSKRTLTETKLQRSLPLFSRHVTPDLYRWL